MRLLSNIYKMVINNRNVYNKIRDAVRRLGATVVFYKTAGERKTFDLVQSIRTQTIFLMNDVEAIHLYNCARAVSKIPGAFAEVGSFMGGSGKLLCEAAPSKQVFLFDTFEGIPDTSDIDVNFSKGDFKASYDFVKALLQPYQNVSIIKGLFPGTAGPVKDLQFSLVHLDVDIYESTLNCLLFFYPRMSPGGIIISHDYNPAEGVRKAFDEFFASKPEPLVDLPTSQCMVVKLGP